MAPASEEATPAMTFLAVMRQRSRIRAMWAYRPADCWNFDLDTQAATARAFHGDDFLAMQSNDTAGDRQAQATSFVASPLELKRTKRSKIFSR